MGLRLEERHRVEQDFHDQAAGHERADFYAWDALAIADQHAYTLLGDLDGKHLLDLGCGQGANALRFARHGARVQAVDLSAGMVEATHAGAAAAGLAGQVDAQQMSAEELRFPDHSFDLVFGHSVLHHTDLAITRSEIRRVLKPGGRAVFLEPLGHNPLLNLFRRLTPWRRTPTERPLTYADIRFFAEPFAGLRLQEFYVVALAAFALVPFGKKALFQAAMRKLAPLDRAALARWPALRKFAWVVVLELQR